MSVISEKAHQRLVKQYCSAELPGNQKAAERCSLQSMARHCKLQNIPNLIKNIALFLKIKCLKWQMTKKLICSFLYSTFWFSADTSCVLHNIPYYSLTFCIVVFFSWICFSYIKKRFWSLWQMQTLVQSDFNPLPLAKTFFRQCNSWN